MDHLLSAVMRGIGKKRRRDNGDSSDTGDDKDYNPNYSTDSDSSYKPKRIKTKSTRKAVTKNCSAKTQSASIVTTNDDKAKATSSRKSKTSVTTTSVKDTKTTAARPSSSRKTKTTASTTDPKAELPSSTLSNNKNDDSTRVNDADTKTRTTVRVMNQGSLSACSSNNKSSTVGLKDMPTDVLLRIVQLVAEDQGILFTMNALSQVCRRLHQFVSVDSLNYKSLLWQRADLSALGRNMSTAVLHSRTLPKFPGLVALNLEGWSSLRDKDVEAICNAYGQTLAEVSLGDSDHLSGKTLAILTSGCRQLRSVSLSRLSSKAVPGQLLTQLTRRHATSLASLTLDTIQYDIVGFDAFLSQLTSSADSLPNLTRLRLANLRPSCSRRVAICPTALSASVPALRELELINIGLSSHLEFLPPAKFNDLRHILIQELKKPYRLAVSPSSLPNLTSLCVLASQVDFNIGCSSYFTGLSRLVLAHCSCLDDNLLTFLLKTSDQLTEVDFTCSASYDMSEYDEGVISPSQNFFSQLHLLRELKRLNLTGTSIPMFMARRIASDLSGSLIELNLTSCKQLPRGFKRRLIGREQIQAWLAVESPRGSDDQASD